MTDKSDKYGNELCGGLWFVAGLADAITDVPSPDCLKPVKETSFRELVGHGVYIKDAFSYLSRSPEELGLEVDGYPDAVTYCFIDDEVGMCFRCLCAAREAKGALELLNAFDEVSLTMRRATVANALCALISRDALAAFEDAISAIDDEHGPDDFTQGMRELVELDDLRNPDFPDVIKTVLMNPSGEDNYELVWAKPWASSDDVPQCVLMSEPSNEAFGAHEGDVFPLTFQKQPDGLIAIALAGGK